VLRLMMRIQISKMFLDKIKLKKMLKPVKIINSGLYGTFKGRFFDKTPQEIRTESRTLMQKKLNKIKKI